MKVNEDLAVQAKIAWHPVDTFFVCSTYKSHTVLQVGEDESIFSRYTVLAQQ